MNAAGYIIPLYTAFACVAEAFLVGEVVAKPADTYMKAFQ
jgi:hypothetical protein